MPSRESELHGQKLDLFEGVLAKKRKDKNKIYSLHDPDVACIAKGKSHKPYEFGSKVDFVLSPSKGIILSAVNFTGNPHDSKTLQPSLENLRKNTSLEPEEAYVDQGYRGKKQIGATKVITPQKGRSAYEKRKYRKRFRERTGIEPLIGHIKDEHRMARNYLKGIVGD